MTEGERVVVIDGVELTVAVVERVRAGETDEVREAELVDVAVFEEVDVAEVDVVELGDCVSFAEALMDEEPVEVVERVLLCVGLGDPDSVGVVVPEREEDPELVEDLEAVRVFGPLGVAVVLTEPVWEADVVMVCFCDGVGCDVPDALRVVDSERDGVDVVVGERLSNEVVVCVTVPTDVTV